MENLNDIDFEWAYTAQYSKFKRYSKEYVWLILMLS